MRNGDSATPISGALANTLAAAANAGYQFSTFWVVARFQPLPGTTRPFNVQPPFASEEEAEKRKEELGPDYGVFGPFQGSSTPRVNQATVAHLDVTTEGGLGPHEPIPIEGQTYDALFYSLQAVEKFVVPYYTQELGVEYGALVLQAFTDSPVALMGHLPWSEEVVVTGPAGKAAGNEAAPDAGAGKVVRQTYRPVIAQRDENGQVQWKRLDPPAPGNP